MLIRVPDVIGNGGVPTPIPWLVRVIQLQCTAPRRLEQTKIFDVKNSKSAQMAK